MSKSTQAIMALQKAGIAFDIVTYPYDPDADRIGLQAALALGVDPSVVLKTLMTEVDGKAVCVVLPSDREVGMKKLAAAVGGKTAHMMLAADAERMTGYRVGGISPFGQKRRVPTVFERSALNEPAVYVNGGQRGLQVRIAPADAVAALEATCATVVADA